MEYVAAAAVGVAVLGLFVWSRQRSRPNSDILISDAAGNVVDPAAFGTPEVRIHLSRANQRLLLRYRAEDGSTVEETVIPRGLVGVGVVGDNFTPRRLYAYSYRTRKGEDYPLDRIVTVADSSTGEVIGDLLAWSYDQARQVAEIDRRITAAPPARRRGVGNDSH